MAARHRVDYGYQPELTEFSVQHLEFRVQSSEFRVQSSAFRVRRSEFGVQDSSPIGLHNLRHLWRSVNALREMRLSTNDADYADESNRL